MEMENRTKVQQLEEIIRQKDSWVNKLHKEYHDQLHKYKDLLNKLNYQMEEKEKYIYELVINNSHTNTNTNTYT